MKNIFTLAVMISTACFVGFAADIQIESKGYHLLEGGITVPCQFADQAEAILADALQDISPEKAIFVLDLNDVIFAKDIKQMAIDSVKTLWKGFYWWALSYKFWLTARDIKKAQQAKVAVESIFNKLMEQYPDLKEYEENYLQLSSDHIVQPIALTVLQKLKEKGYALYAFTNMGEKTIQRMQERFPEVFSYFTGVYSANAKNGYVVKPNPEAYVGFKKFLAEQENTDGKQLFFTDDALENLEEASRNGMIGIECSSIEHVYNTLADWNVISKEN